MRQLSIFQHLPITSMLLLYSLWGGNKEVAFWKRIFGGLTYHTLELPLDTCNGSHKSKKFKNLADAFESNAFCRMIWIIFVFLFAECALLANDSFLLRVYSARRQWSCKNIFSGKRPSRLWMESNSIWSFIIHYSSKFQIIIIIMWGQGIDLKPKPKPKPNSWGGRGWKRRVGWCKEGKNTKVWWGQEGMLLAGSCFTVVAVRGRWVERQEQKVGSSPRGPWDMWEKRARKCMPPALPAMFSKRVAGMNAIKHA